MLITGKKPTDQAWKYSRNLIITGILITWAYTPWFNKDSLTIPKQTLLFMISMYFLPKIILEIHNLNRLKGGKLVLLPIGLIFIQLIFIIFFSGAPVEQQIYGRDGRLLGAITFFSLIIILLVSIRYFNKEKVNLILQGIFISNLPISIYAVLQSYGIDFFNWESRTNMVISTLGNPNFVSAFAAFAVLPSIVYVRRYKYKYYFQTLIFIGTIFTIYRTQSIQGYLAIFFAGSIYLFLYQIFRYKKLLVFYIPFVLIGTFVSVFGMLGHGPLAKFLYKISVQSRGDFWRAAWNKAENNPVLGVGLDSFGENFLKYRDAVAANHTFAEFTDSAHNYLLDYAAFGGIFLAVLNISLLGLTVYFFIRVQLYIKKVDDNLISIFCAWCALQATLLISPMSLVSLFWSNILSGAIIGVGLRILNTGSRLDDLNDNKEIKMRTTLMPISALLAFLLMLPLISSDRLYLKSLNTSDGNLGIKVVNNFPRSTQKFSTVGRLLHESGEYQYALDVARKAIEFNEKNFTGYALIMINPLASVEERKKAKQILLTLDPFNKEVPSYQISLSSSN